MWAISAPDWSDFDDCTNIVCGEDGCGGDDDFDDDGDDYFDDAHLDLDHDNVGSILIVSEVVDDLKDHNNADIYIMMQCLFVTFLFIPAPPPAPSCYVWIKRKVESRK